MLPLVFLRAQELKVVVLSLDHPEFVLGAGVVGLARLLEPYDLHVELVVLLHDPFVLFLQWFLLWVIKMQGKINRMFNWQTNEVERSMTYVLGLGTNLSFELIIHLLELVEGLSCLQVVVEKLLCERGRLDSCMGSTC